MKDCKTLIFFAKYLDGSGSDALLKTLVNSLVHNPKFKIILVGYSDGYLMNEIDSRVQYVSYSSYRRKESTFLKRQKRKVFSMKNYDVDSEFFKNIHSKYSGATWILNTLAVVLPLNFIKQNKIQSIIWIHEMDVCYYWLNNKELELFREVPDVYICVSNAVASFVRNLHPRGDVKIIYPGVMSGNNLELSILGKESAHKGKFIIGMSGGIDVNKNPVYLVNFALYLKAKDDQRFKIIWVGGDISNGMFSYLNYVIENNELSDFIQFTGHQKKNYLQFIQKMDLFLLTSYVDSFPLVILEASSLGIPIAGWNSGGIIEFVNSKAIGEILPERSFDTLYEFLSSCVTGKRIFDKDLIIKRSLYFSKERFLEEFEQLLIEKTGLEDRC